MSVSSRPPTDFRQISGQDVYWLDKSQDRMYVRRKSIRTGCMFIGKVSGQDVYW